MYGKIVQEFLGGGDLEDSVVDGLLATQTVSESGYTIEIPAEYGTFLGVPIKAIIDTLPLKRDNPPPVNNVEEALFRLIMNNLQTVLPAAEASFLEYNEEYPEVRAHVANPHIWIYRDNIEEDGPTRWTFIVELSAAPDYGFHIEFDALEVLEIWSGD